MLVTRKTNKALHLPCAADGKFRDSSAKTVGSTLGCSVTGTHAEVLRVFARHVSI